MPIYEYWCKNCKKKYDIYSPVFTSDNPVCPACNKTSLQRLLSTFMVQKSYKDIYDNILSDAQLMKGMMGNDPRALVEWNKRMSGGEPVAPEYRETMEKMERGEMPTSPIGSEAAFDGQTSITE
jgi:putative FmdB family regulatory protein